MPFEKLRSRTPILGHEPKQQMLGADVIIAELPGLFFGLVEHTPHRVAECGLATVLELRQSLELVRELFFEPSWINACLEQNLRDDAVNLRDKAKEQGLWLELR